jgi:hypothetical protein
VKPKQTHKVKRFWLAMADSDNDSGGQNNSNNANDFSAQEQDRFLPITNVSRIMKKALPANAKITSIISLRTQDHKSLFFFFFCLFKEIQIVHEQIKEIAFCFSPIKSSHSTMVVFDKYFLDVLFMDTLFTILSFSSKK